MLLSEMKNKRVLIWGFGREGKIVFEILRKQFPKQKITILDNNKPQMENKFVIETSDEIQILEHDIIIKSPGISLYKDIIQKAKNENIKITSSMNIFFAEVANSKDRKNKIIGITGTLGKTTTSAITAHILDKLGYKVGLCGNIGKSIMLYYENYKNYDFIIIELSSYQISDLEYFPDIAILTNLFPEHIQWHNNSHEVYYKDKLNLIKNTKVRLVNARDELTQKYTKNIKNKILFNEDKGFHCMGNEIFHESRPILNMDELEILGKHNLHNISAILTLCETLGLPLTKVLEAIKTYKGMPHRLQIIGVANGIKYVDDSISTIPETAIAAMETFPDDITIILGGFDRKQDFADLAKYINLATRVKTVITLGQTGSRIYNALDKKKTNCLKAEDLTEAVKMAKNETKSGVILLSPASPSNDMFKDFEERGQEFKKLCGF